MKKSILVSGLIVLCGMQVTVYANNPVPATIWYGVTRYISPYVDTRYQSVSFFLKGDTIINDTLYHAFWRHDDTYCAGIRFSENGQQVYIRPTQQLLNDRYWTAGDHLLYDFDVHVGDTVFAFDGSYSGIDNMDQDRFLQYRWVVQDIQTIDGRKHVQVQGGQLNHQVEWIEGIGTAYILFENNYDDALGTRSTYALCVTDNEGSILYSFDTDYIGVHNNCPNWEPMAIEEIHISSSASKIIRDGHLYILYGERMYNVEGIRVK